jgi:hypothetical protein
MHVGCHRATHFGKLANDYSPSHPAACPRHLQGLFGSTDTPMSSNSLNAILDDLGK